MLPPKGVLKVNYDYTRIKKSSLSQLLENQWLPLLPIDNLNNLPTLRVGGTPIYQHTSFLGRTYHFTLLLKDESQNPTFSFKDRASALVSAYAKEKNIGILTAASTGNAGSSLAGICASQRQKSIIFVPEKAPIAKLTQILMYGATLVPVRGNYDQAFEMSIKATELYGWYNRNTAFNPLTIEGKKTAAFEIFHQLRSVPDRIFIPVGDGVILSGIYKGFEDLLKLNLIENLPKIIAVQSEQSKNFVANINRVDFIIEPSTTLADSISVDVPRNFYMAKQYIQKYEGECITVSDQEILKASKALAENTGLFQEPAAATAFAGFLKYLNDNRINADEKVMVLLTGSGLKDLKSVSTMLSTPRSIDPEVNDLVQFFKQQKISENYR